VKQLHQFGWSDGVNLSIEWRFAEGKTNLMPELAAELVQLPVEVLFASGAVAALPAHQQTNTIPIVTSANDQTILELVQSIARPARNVTGATIGSTTTGIKSVELLRSVLPQRPRLAILTDPSLPAYTPEVVPAERTAQTLGIQFQELHVRTVEDVDGAVEAARAWAADGLLAIGGSLYSVGVYARVSELAARNHVPAMYPDPAVVTDEGGLMAFTWDRLSMNRQLAEYVDRILRGASPADLPVQEPRQFDFLVNVKAAQALGITFPPDVVAQVTQWVQ
jgi:putative ABC transport system substrate-binding protein